MSALPSSPYPAPKCGIYVEGGVASYPCSLHKEHAGPCYAIEVESSRIKRERWERENPEVVEGEKSRLEAMRSGNTPQQEPPAAGPPVTQDDGSKGSVFVEDMPDPVVEANTPKKRSLPGTDSLQRHMDDDAAKAHRAVNAMEEIVDALSEVYDRDDVSNDPVAAVQRIVGEHQGMATKIKQQVQAGQ